MVNLIYDERFLKHYSELYSHPESPSRLTMALNALKSYGALDKVAVVNRVEELNYELPYEVHDKDYVELIRTLSAKGFNYVDSDTYVNSHTFEVAILALSASILAHKLCISTGRPSYVIARPPGHHAGIRGRALGAPTLGFCIFNNIAVLAKRLLKEGFKNIVIIDIDAHHGNGTQEIFISEPKVIHIDIHQQGIYPGTGELYEVGIGDGEGSKINIPLPAGSGDDIYKEVFNEVIEPLINEVEPEYILISAGYDAHYSDPLTDLRATAMTYYYYFRKLNELAGTLCSGRLVAILEGGYGEGLSKGILNSIAALNNEEPYITESETLSSYRPQAVIGRVKEVIKRYWKLS